MATELTADKTRFFVIEMIKYDGEVDSSNHVQDRQAALNLLVGCQTVE